LQELICHHHAFGWFWICEDCPNTILYALTTAEKFIHWISAKSRAKSSIPVKRNRWLVRDIEVGQLEHKLFCFEICQLYVFAMYYPDIFKLLCVK